MKKSLIALAALSAFATAAQAQSSVTIYGSIDAGYSSHEKDFTDTGATNAQAAASFKDVKNTGMNAVTSPLTSSRLGFRGVEDLGGGLSATFNIETGMTTTDGTMFSGAARTAIVGLSDKAMGTLQVGRQLTGLHGVVAGYNAIAGSNMVGDVLYSSEMMMHNSSALGANSIAAIGGTNGALRVNNMLTYLSPTMNGFNARVDYAKDSRDADAATAGKDATTDYQGLTLNYAQGPLRLSAATSSMKSKAAHATATPWICASADATSVVTNSTSACASPLRTVVAGNSLVNATNDDSKAKYNAISAAYQVNPALSLQASYAENEFSAEGVKTHEASGYRLGANYVTGKWVLAAQYGKAEVKSPTATALMGTEADRTAYQLAAIYNLSKRTNLYAAYGQQEQEITAASTGVTVIGDSVKSTQTAVGVRHSF
jgi:predicted porin